MCQMVLLIMVKNETTGAFPHNLCPEIAKIYTQRTRKPESSPFSDFLEKYSADRLNPAGNSGGHTCH